MTIIQSLKQFNFTDYEARVFSALSLLGVSKASDIAKHSGVPSNKVYESLIRLAEQGFVSAIPLSPCQYKIASMQPFDEIIEKKSEEIEHLKNEMHTIHTIISQQPKSLQDICLVLKGKKQIVQKLREISPSITSYQYTLGGNLVWTATSERLVRDAIRRGVDMRFIVHFEKSRSKVYSTWKKSGVQIRFYSKTEQKSIRFSSIDGKWCRVTIGKPQMPSEEDYLSFWLESPAFSLFLKEQFLHLWQNSSETTPR